MGVDLDIFFGCDSDGAFGGDGDEPSILSYCLYALSFFFFAPVSDFTYSMWVFCASLYALPPFFFLLLHLLMTLHFPYERFMFACKYTFFFFHLFLHLSFYYKGLSRIIMRRKCNFYVLVLSLVQATVRPHLLRAVCCAIY